MADGEPQLAKPRTEDRVWRHCPAPDLRESAAHAEAPADVYGGDSWGYAGVGPALRDALSHVPCLCSVGHPQ